MSETATPVPRVRVRWGWITTCILLGLAGIAAGFALVAPADRTGYLASVLAGVGTTLLLVGVVVLLERRIIATTANVVQRAVDAERQASEERIGRLVADVEDRMAAEWARLDPSDPTTTRRRSAELTDAMVASLVDEASGAAHGRRPPAPWTSVRAVAARHRTMAAARRIRRPNAPRLRSWRTGGDLW